MDWTDFKMDGGALMQIDFGEFEERSAIMEFDGGLSRFEAETRAAAAQGLKRHEVLDAIRNRNSARGRDIRQAVDGKPGSDDLPGMQRAPEEEDRPVPERDAQAGRDRVALLALRA